MTTTVDEVIIRLLATRSDARDFAEAVVVVVFVALLIVLSTVLRPGGPRPRRGAVTAIAAVLGIAWMTVVTQRFFALL